MKTKNNTFKRIAAGALATISVATNVMSANVGGSLFVDTMRAALVAQAADGTVDFSGINKYLTSFSNGKTTFDANALAGITSFAAKEGDTVTVKSSIPLNFMKASTAAEAGVGAVGTIKVDDAYYVPTEDVADYTNTYKDVVTAIVKNGVVTAVNNGDVDVDLEAKAFNKTAANLKAYGNDVYEKSQEADAFVKFENRCVLDATGDLIEATAENEYKYDTNYSVKTGFKAYDEATHAFVDALNADNKDTLSYYADNCNVFEDALVEGTYYVVTTVKPAEYEGKYYSLLNNKLVEIQNETAGCYFVATADVNKKYDISYSVTNGYVAYDDTAHTFTTNVTNENKETLTYYSGNTNYTPYNTSTVKDEVDYKVFRAVNAETDNDTTKFYKFKEQKITGYDAGAADTYAATAVTADALANADAISTTYATTGNEYLKIGENEFAQSKTVDYGIGFTATKYNKVVLEDNFIDVDGTFYKKVDQQQDNENEATTLKNGRVYFTKSGNSYVYSYKINSNIKIIGQEATVEITNGLPTAYDANHESSLNSWGDSTERALLKGIRTPVANLKFKSDKTFTIDDEKNVVGVDTNTYSEAVDTSTNVTENLVAYKNENVVLSATEYFKARVWDGNQKTAYKEYATTFNSKTNKWECTFPVYVDAAGNKTRVLVEKADPVYTYTTSGSVLKVSGSGIDEEAAYIKAYAVPKKDQATQVGKPTEPEEVKKYAITSGASLTNESMVYVDLARISEFASATNTSGKPSTLKITRNGKEIKADPAFDAENPKAHLAEGTTVWNDLNENDNKFGAFVTNQPGEYEITYTVYINANKTTAVAKELKFKFTIETKSKLTASNVELTFSSKDNVITGATYNDTTEKFEKKVTGAENLKLPVDVEDLKNKSIDVTAILKDAEGVVIDGITLSGATTVNELNLLQPLYITYNNDQYSTGAETIVINWQAVSKAKQFNIFESDGETPLYDEGALTNYPINVSVDEIADIQKSVESHYVLKNGDAKKISYEYSVGKGDKLESQELDWHEAGFPKEIGEYSLYILYANEPIAVVDLNVIKHSLHAAPTASQLNITYGDKLFTEEELGYVDAQGNAVKDAAVKNPDIKIYETELVQDAQVKQIVDGKLNGAPVYEKDGKYYTLGDAVGNPYDAPLNAGVYVAEIKAKNATTVGKADYTLMSDKFVLNVAKKQITSNMITIAPQTYDGINTFVLGGTTNEALNIKGVGITGVDTAIRKNFPNAPANAENVALKAASGVQSAKEISANKANITVNDKAEVQNYTGTVKDFKWYIIKGAEKDGENYSGLFWNDTETTIVDNGNINVEFGKSANLVGEVVEFGFIGDKSGKIGAPAIADGESYMSNKSNHIYDYSKNFNPATGVEIEPDADDPDNKADKNVQAAYKELVYGAGVTPAKQNAAMIAKKGADTFGVSVRIEDANTGVWVRPYLILKVDGEEKLYYGEVRYLNLVEEATAMLNLKASAIADEANDDGVDQPAFTKDQAKAQYTDNTDLAYMEDAKSGYWAEKNQFYAYAHYNFDKNSKVKDSAIQGFGVVLDKSGYIPALVDEEGTPAEIAAAQAKNAETRAKAKEVLIPANKGKNGILSGISKDNPKMLKNEMGVAVNPKDAVTGVWLRSFVDFGNGLIVYTNPVYIKSVSEQYAAFKPYVEAEKAPNAAKINYKVKANHVNPVPKYNGANAVIKEAGVVVDKNGTLFKLDENDATKYTDFVDDITTKFIAENATANGYNKGKKGIDINPGIDGEIFTGHALQATNKSGNYIKTVARPFVVYTINGKDITIYGDPDVDDTANTTYPQPAID